MGSSVILYVGADGRAATTDPAAACAVAPKKLKTSAPLPIPHSSFANETRSVEIRLVGFALQNKQRCKTN